MTETPKPVRTRIAPSPTGEPHIGNLYVALVNWAHARQTGGQFLVRIEDTDRTRFVEGAEQMFLDALAWLGLDHDEGPDVGGPAGPYRQSERLAIYRREVARLLASGHAYRCFCSPERLAQVRKERQKAGGETGYDRLCRDLAPGEVEKKLAAGEKATVRLAVPLEGETRFEDGVRGPITVRNETIDDQVLLKSDGYPTYHLASVVDDHAMRITHVVRAEEWIISTPKHILLYEALGWTPPQFFHLPLIRNPDRSKLSKRKNPTNVLWYREQGYLAEAVTNFLGMLGHSMPDGREIFSREEFLAEFSLARVTTTGPVFDMEKFEWLNGEWIRRLPLEKVAARLKAEGFVPKAILEKFDGPGAPGFLAIVALVQERLRRLNEFADATAFFAERLPYKPQDLIPEKKGKPLHTAAETLAALERLRDALAEAPASAAGEADGPAWETKALEELVRALAAELGWKPADLFMTLRVAVTCRKVSTPLFETMEILGREECLARVDGAIGKIAD
ncbi:MAG: glutamate--tRNA ligase [Planctomycetota bacterium]|nr:glutamate--tRNA ligase [Planctomycetota bacterium]